MRRKWFWWAVDVLLALLLTMTGLVKLASFEQQKPSAPTYGQYAVTMNAATHDDIDLYCKDPKGDVAWYGGLSGGPLTLDHDSIPGATDPYAYGEHERVIVREAITGEYVCGANIYNRIDAKPITATVTLWDLRGNDHVLLTRQLVFTGAKGEWLTGFRFEIGNGGQYTGHNFLPFNIISKPLPVGKRTP